MIPTNTSEVTPEVIHGVVTRLAALERQNRMLKRAGIAAILCVIASIAIGWRAYDVVQQYAGHFFIVDQDGNRKGSFSVNDKTGMGQILLGVTETQPGGETRVLQSNFTLGYQLENKQPYLGIWDQKGQIRVMLGVDARGATRFALWDATGKLIWAPPEQ